MFILWLPNRAVGEAASPEQIWRPPIRSRIEKQGIGTTKKAMTAGRPPIRELPLTGSGICLIIKELESFLSKRFLF
jgi:hypothetical protein